METFLQLVANDIYQKLGRDMSRVAVVFPNKRAGLFFNEYLSTLSDEPVWSPTYLSISELMQQLSELQLGDPIQLVCELYKVFCAQTETPETLDEFYFWGEMLIADFDDVDKNLVPAHQLFSNLQDLKELMPGFDFLDEEQKQAIQQFFFNFSIDKKTELKDRFTRLWNRLRFIYEDYRAALRSKKMAYEGMLYRDVIEHLEVDSLKYDSYLFVGFNVLSKVEISLFSRLQEAGRALFYWDYDHFYLDDLNHEGGEFIRRNLKMFPSQLRSGEIFRQLGTPKKVRFIASSTESGQARYLSDWAREHTSPVERENAVVLCNEALLLPVLHSLPDGLKNINITMGYPLAQTPVFSFIEAVTDLQIAGYKKDSGRFTYASVVAVLKHPYVRQLSAQAEDLEQMLTVRNRFYPHPSELQVDDLLTFLFQPVNGNRDFCHYLAQLLQRLTGLFQQAENSNELFNQLYRESLFRAFTLVNRLLSLIDTGDLEVKPTTLRSLLNRLMAGSSIPFHGEPAVGLQVLGVLETRNLDFRNMIILSVNEGKLPKGVNESSFIPYNLRKAFGMTTIEHKNAVYAYYFYRMIQRAESVTMLYNTSTDGLNRGEMSRFMLQFLADWKYPIERYVLEAGQKPKVSEPIVIEKEEEVMKRLKSITRLSPSALNTYLDCRLKFYYKYVAHLKMPDEVSAEIDSAKFGTIFHEAAEHIYKDLCVNGTLIRPEDLEALLKHPYRLQDYVDAAFKKHFFQVSPDEKPEYNGVQLLNSKVILSYLRQLLRVDKTYAPFVFAGAEQPVEEPITFVTYDNEEQTVVMGGVIDRMDVKDGVLRIVDYKTGGTPIIPNAMEQLFKPAEHRPGYIFQTFLYAAIMCKTQSLKVAPSLIYIHKAASESYSPVIEMGQFKQRVQVTNFSLLEDDFRERLENLLQEIYDPNEAFKQTEFKKQCDYCDFKSICSR